MLAPGGLAGGALAGVRVLLVEDLDELRVMLAEYLRDFGLEVVQARSGREALERFKASRPALVVSDIEMPDGDGISLIRAIRGLRTEDGGLTPAIAVSGRGNVDEAVLAGFDVFLQKPANPAQIVAVIDYFVHGSPANR